MNEKHKYINKHFFFKKKVILKINNFFPRNEYG